MLLGSPRRESAGSTSGDEAPKFPFTLDTHSECRTGTCSVSPTSKLYLSRRNSLAGHFDTNNSSSSLSDASSTRAESPTSVLTTTLLSHSLPVSLVSTLITSGLGGANTDVSGGSAPSPTICTVIRDSWGFGSSATGGNGHWQTGESSSSSVKKDRSIGGSCPKSDSTVRGSAGTGGSATVSVPSTSTISSSDTVIFVTISGLERADQFYIKTYIYSNTFYF